MNIVAFLRSLVFYSVMGLIIVVTAVPAIVIACLPARWRYDNWLHGRLSQMAYWLLVKATLLPVEVIGRENIPNESCIFAANHQSFLDIPLLGTLARGKPHFWFLKHELASIPVFGFFVRRMGITVDRRTLGKATQAISNGLKISNGGQRHVMIFPEGARFVDGEIHAFLSGFAILAKQTQRPVVPVLLFNTGKAAAPGVFVLTYTTLRMVIGKPFRIAADESERAFVQRVYQWFVENNRK